MKKAILIIFLIFAIFPLGVCGMEAVDMVFEKMTKENTFIVTTENLFIRKTLQIFLTPLRSI